jgi:bacterioferritin
MNKNEVIKALNEALEGELGEMVRYIHHSFHVYGHGRNPIVGLLRARAKESMDHAILLGEKIIALGGNPTAKVSEVLEPKKETVEEILKDTLAAEKESLETYKKYLPLVQDDVALDFLLRKQIADEQEHVDELEKLLRE